MNSCPPSGRWPGNSRPTRLIVPQFMKAMVHYGMEGSMTAGLALEKFAQGALCETEDKAEGLRAFLEKRKPKWKGR